MHGKGLCGAEADSKVVTLSSYEDEGVGCSAELLSYLCGGGGVCRLHLLSTLQEAAHVFCTVAHGCLVLSKTFLKGLKRLRTSLADLPDDWAAGAGHFRPGETSTPLPTPLHLPRTCPHSLGGRALSNAHLKVVTVSLP